MKRRNKILCLVVLFALMFGGMGFASFMAPTNAVIEPTRPGGSFAIAAAATSDALGIATNNITNTNGAAGALYVFAGAYEQYTLVLNVSDADGHVDILNVTVEFVSTAAVGTSLGGFFIDTTTAVNTVTELAVNAGNVRLSAGSTNVSTANTQDITIPFYFEWDIGTVANVDINVTVMEAAAFTELTKDTNIDIVGTTTLSDVGLFDYVDYLNGVNMGTAHVIYHYTGYTTVFPLGAETDFYAWRAAVPAESISQRSWVDTSYVDGTGVATFAGIMAPDTNTRQLLNFTLIAVDLAGGANATDLNAATTYASAVWVDPNAPLHTGPGDTGPFISPDVFGTPEGVLLIGGVAIVVMAGGYYAYGRNSTSTSRRRTSKRKTTKRKKRKR